MTVDELLAKAAPTIGSLGAKWFFAPETLARGKTLDLDGFQFYFLGRGGVLGDVEAPVIVSAFGYFNPELVARVWDSARQKISPRDAARAYVTCCQEYGRARFCDLEGLGEFCEAATAVDDAADRAGLSLYAGWSAEPRADDLPGRAAQLTAVLRELRGGAHLVAVLASGLTPKTAHYLRRPGDLSLFGWADDEVPEVGKEDRARLDAAEALTDDLVRSAFSVLDDAGRDALVTGLARMQEARRRHASLDDAGRDELVNGLARA